MGERIWKQERMRALMKNRTLPNDGLMAFVELVNNGNDPLTR